MLSSSIRHRIGRLTLLIVLALAWLPPSGHAQSCATVATGSGGFRCKTVNAACSPVDIGVGNKGKCKTLGPASEAECDCVGQPPPTYTISANQLVPASVVPAGSANSLVVVSGGAGYQGTVSLFCSSVTGGGSPAPSCQFTPSKVALTSGSSQVSRLTVSTTPSTPLATYTIAVSATDTTSTGPSDGVQSLTLQTQKADIDQPMASATFVNLYWDSSWDSDGQPAQVATIDAVTQAVVDSSYFANLAEYGVTSVSFAGSFLPDPSCPSKAPASVGFYDPINTSIAGFIQCEHDHGPAILRQSNVVYNVILPASSMESDFWSKNFCNGSGSPDAWHYHGLEDSPPIFGPGPFGGTPIYTITLTNPQCGSGNFFLESLFHEMVEAVTDPFPIDISIIPPHINIAMENEIADVCEGKDVTTFADSHGVSPLLMPVSIPSYWSNQQMACVNFADKTAPAITSVSVSNWGSQTSLSISGTGFGAMSAQIGLPNAGLPYVELQSSSPRWEAGNTINLDKVHLSIPNWSGTQVTNIGFVGTGINTVPNTPLTAWICNPSSLNCISAATQSAQGPYNPRLTAFNIVTGAFDSTDVISISAAGQQVMTNDLHGLCNPCTFSALNTFPPGSYALVQNVSGPVPLTRVSNGCQQVVLSSGEETSCTIIDQGPSASGGSCTRNGKVGTCCETSGTRCTQCAIPPARCP